MTNPSKDFLEDLDRRGHVRLFEKVQGRLRLDLAEETGGDSWFVVIEKGDIHVSRRREDADCVIRAERVFFDRVVTGEANAIAALLRGLIQIEGKLRLALSLWRLLPGPPQSRWRGHRRAQPTRKGAP